MDISRREFFKQFGSKNTLRTVVKIASHGVGDLLEEEEITPLSMEEAGRALRKARRYGAPSPTSKKHSPPNERAGSTRMLDSGETDREPGTRAENSQTSQAADTDS